MTVIKFNSDCDFLTMRTMPPDLDNRIKKRVSSFRTRLRKLGIDENDFYEQYKKWKEKNPELYEADKARKRSGKSLRTISGPKVNITPEEVIEEPEKIEEKEAPIVADIQYEGPRSFEQVENVKKSNTVYYIIGGGIVVIGLFKFYTFIKPLANKPKKEPEQQVQEKPPVVGLLVEKPAPLKITGLRV